METIQPTGIDVVIGASDIHGNGCFALQTIHSGHLIGAYEGRVSYDAKNPYTLWLYDERGASYGILGENALRYMNHSENPTAECDGLHVYAMDTIRPGDEITISYGEDWEPSDAG